MYQRIAIFALCLIALAGCERRGAMVSQVMADRVAGENQEFSVTNFWSLRMNRDSITPRFERTRAACLNDKALNCKLQNSNLTLANGSAYSSSSASLELLLPHDKIDGFKKSVTAPLPKETPNEVALQSSSTRAENVEGESANAGRKVTGLTSYRDTLVGLRKRPNLSIDDIIKLEAEISRVQEELDDAVKAKALVDGKLARESVHIILEERPEGAIASVWNRAADSFNDSVADALDFLIRAIPWLPIIAAGVILVTWLVRLLWRKKQATD